MQKVAVVTGAERGIGHEIAKGLKALGYDVRATGRSVLDVANAKSIATFASTLGAFDVLVNNAGISLDGFDATTAQKTLDVNFFGAMNVTDALLPRMNAGGRIVMVSSGMGELTCLGSVLRSEIDRDTLSRNDLQAFAQRFVDDVRSGTHTKNGWPSNAYRVSKVLMNALVRVLAREQSAIKVNAACPGWVRTNMGGSSAPRSPEEGARTPVWLATLPPDGPTGGFFRDEKPIPW